MKFLFTFFILFLPIVSHGAISWDSYPTGNVNNPITVQITLDPQVDLDEDTLTAPLWGLEFWGLDIDGYPTELLNQCYPTTDIGTTTYTFTGTLTERSYAVIAISGSGDCSSVNAGGVIYIGDDTQTTALFTITTSSQNESIWGGNNGFWGSTTISDISTAMTASVQETGINLYSLFQFMGIPILFTVALLLIAMINKTLTPEEEDEVIKEKPKRKRGRPKKTIINPQGEELIEHSVSDLEFKRNYGRSNDN